MDDSPRKPQWWLIITAAVLAILTLFYYTGSWIMVLLFFAALGTLVAWQMVRSSPIAADASRTFSAIVVVDRAASCARSNCIIDSDTSRAACISSPWLSGP